MHDQVYAGSSAPEISSTGYRERQQSTSLATVKTSDRNGAISEECTLVFRVLDTWRSGITGAERGYS